MSDRPTSPAPVIGLTAYRARARWGVWDAEAALLPWAYVDAVSRAGGVPVLLPPLPGVVDMTLARLDGVLLAGGPDVDPARYGQEAGPHTQVTSPDRDAAETGVLHEAIDAGLPVLGICRGLQIINVARGGTLHQHVPDRVGHDGHAPAPGVIGRHAVHVDAGTRLAGALGRTTVDAVPTYHHQAVDVLGTRLAATAWADDGTIEALEDPDLPFCVAVQWHPEEGDDDALFSALVSAARAARASRSTRSEAAGTRSAA